MNPDPTLSLIAVLELIHHGFFLCIEWNKLLDGSCLQALKDKAIRFQSPVGFFRCILSTLMSQQFHTPHFDLLYKKRCFVIIASPISDSTSSIQL